MTDMTIETRSALPIETRDETGADQIGAAVQAVEELRTAVTTSAGEVRTAVDGVRTDLTALAARVDGLETRMQRPGGGNQNPAEPTLHHRAFASFIRNGREAMQPDEVRSLVVSDSTKGGYLAPPEFVAELDRNLVLQSPIRAVARIASTAAGNVQLPRRTAGLTGGWVNETQTRPEATASYGMTDLPVNEIACFVDISNQLLEDSAFNMESELAFDFAEEFGRVEGQAFVSGDGIGKPLGILNTAGIPTVPSLNATAVTSDALFDLFYALPTMYAANGTWGLRRSVIGAVRKLKDTTGQYLWNPAIREGEPATLLGRPVVDMPDMPDEAAGAKAIVFGDFSHFRIFDRVAISVLRDPYSVQTQGKTRFHGRRRLAAGVTKPEAFRIMTIAAS